jgi:hypothetical protein
MTRDPRILKAILSEKFKDFSITEERGRALGVLLGDGIFTSDGQSWRHSRALLRPYFRRPTTADLQNMKNTFVVSLT